MTVIKIDHQRETVHLPVRHRAVYPVDKQMVLLAGIPLPIRAVKINELSPLWPASHFRDEMLSAASQWVSQMAKRGFSLFDHEGDIRVYGPYKPKPWERAGGDLHSGGGSDLSGHMTDTADFLLYANFLASAGRTYEEDHEQLAAAGGKLYDEAMKQTGNDVLRAGLLLPPELRGGSQASKLAVDLVDQRERSVLQSLGLPWQ